MTLAEHLSDWVPAKQSLEALEGHIVRLKGACDDGDRDFRELKLVVKPGPGPDPQSGAPSRRFQGQDVPHGPLGLQIYRR